MLKFKYHYLNHTLAYQTKEQAEENLWYQISETETFTGNFGSQGFNLPSGWMSFNVYEKQIKVFYKQLAEPLELNDFFTPEKITYYRQYLPKEDPVIFSFTKEDEVEKIDGRWIRKGVNR